MLIRYAPSIELDTNDIKNNIEDATINPMIIYFDVFALFVILFFGIVSREKHGIVVRRLFINPAFIGPFRPNSNIGFRLSKWISFFTENTARRKIGINIIRKIELILDMVSISLFKVKNNVIPNIIMIYKIFVSDRYWDTIKLDKLNTIVIATPRNSRANI